MEKSKKKPLLSRFQDSKLAKQLAVMALLVGIGAGGLHYAKANNSDKPVEAVEPVNEIPRVINEVTVIG